MIDRENNRQLYVKLKQRIHTAEVWKQINPILAPGEIGVEEFEVEAPLKILTYSELAKRVNDLTSYCQLLAEQNRLLEDCILEMSQQLYQ